MSSQEKKSTFFGGAAILAAGIVIVKLIGALFRIPIIDAIGSNGNAHFSNAYDIFNVLLMISTAGLPVAPRYLRVFAKPLLATLVMGGAVWAAYGLLLPVVGNTLATLGSIALGGTIYLVLVVFLRVLSKEDLSLMPKGDKIANFLRL